MSSRVALSIDVIDMWEYRRPAKWRETWHDRPRRRLGVTIKMTVYRSRLLGYGLHSTGWRWRLLMKYLLMKRFLMKCLSRKRIRISWQAEILVEALLHGGSSLVLWLGPSFSMTPNNNESLLNFESHNLTQQNSRGVICLFQKKLYNQKFQTYRLRRR